MNAECVQKVSMNSDCAPKFFLMHADHGVKLFGLCSVSGYCKSYDSFYTNKITQGGKFLKKAF